VPGRITRVIESVAERDDGYPVLVIAGAFVAK
jgi:hypothetical protein